MKKSRNISLHLVTVLSTAALASGCGSTQPSAAGWQNCVDKQNRVVDRKNCDEESRQTHGMGYYPFYRWYYYPHGGYASAPMIGETVPTGGSYLTAPHSAVSVGRTGTVTRGGFGGIFSGTSVGG